MSFSLTARNYIYEFVSKSSGDLEAEMVTEVLLSCQSPTVQAKLSKKAAKKFFKSSILPSSFKPERSVSSNMQITSVQVSSILMGVHNCRSIT